MRDERMRIGNSSDNYKKRFHCSKSVLYQSSSDGFRLLSHQDKMNHFEGKRDDLFYKTFVRDVRKFWQDSMISYTGYKKEEKGLHGLHFYRCLTQFESHMQLSLGQKFSSEVMICYLGSLINQREFSKSCPKHLLKLSK